MRYEKDLIEEVLRQADIVKVISSYINVIKKGRSFVSICPFHDDKNPSMMISPEKQIFKCFVCGTGGNAISFVEKYEKISFEEATKKVAEIVGFHDDRLIKQAPKVYVDESLLPLYDCLTDLTTFYQYGLSTAEGQVARTYLESRNIPPVQIAKFKLGYSLNDGKSTVNYLEKKGYSLKTIENIGIALAKATGTSDNNAGRLVFPLCDINGQVVGYSARRLSENKEESKYVNSPETRVFHKGSLLYNLHNAKDSAKRDGYIYVLEGFMDVFALDRIGINSAVALMGTSLSKEQAMIFRRLNVEVRLCLDGDAPGQNAMMKILPILSEVGVQCRIVSHPKDDRDPDDVLQSDGEEALRKYISSLIDSNEFMLSYYENTHQLGTMEERKDVLRKFLPLITGLKSQFEVDNLIFKLANITRFEPEAIKELVKNAKNKKEAQGEQTADFNFVSTFHPERKTIRRLDMAEKEVLYQMLGNKEAIDFYENKIESFYDEIHRTIANFLIDYAQNHEKIDVNLVINELQMSDVQNKEPLINEVASLSLEIHHPTCTEQLLNDCKEVIDDEKIKFYEKDMLEKSLVGKSATEKARIINDFTKKKRQEELNKKKS